MRTWVRSRGRRDDEGYISVWGVVALGLLPVMAILLALGLIFSVIATVVDHWVIALCFLCTVVFPVVVGMVVGHRAASPSMEVDALRKWTRRKAALLAGIDWWTGRAVIAWLAAGVVGLVRLAT